jgi:signal transduction histidine kinase
MRNLELLEQLQTVWVSNVGCCLAGGEGVKQSLIFQLDRYYDLLELAVSNNDPTLMDKLLEEWIESRTLSDYQKDHGLQPVLNQLFLETINASKMKLTVRENLDLLDDLLPVYAHIFEYTNLKEDQLLAATVTRDLEKVNSTLEKLDRSKSDFIAIAAHELKTPLTLIEGYTSMVRENLPAQDPQNEIWLFLKGIEAGASRLREIIDDMIDVSMIDNDLLSLNFQPVWIGQILQMVQKDFINLAKERRQVLKLVPFPGSELMTFGDAGRLFQAFHNVISNAIKFTPDGGSVIIGGQILPGFIEVTIKDTGIGIAPENQSRIFEKFGWVGSASLHSTGKTKFKGGGPGLGLPIAKGIIQAHEGTIWVESDGHDEVKCPGTTFHILLPLRLEPPDDHTAKLFGPLFAGEKLKDGEKKS